MHGHLHSSINLLTSIKAHVFIQKWREYARKTDSLSEISRVFREDPRHSWTWGDINQAGSRSESFSTSSTHGTVKNRIISIVNHETTIELTVSKGHRFVSKISKSWFDIMNLSTSVLETLESTWELSQYLNKKSWYFRKHLGASQIIHRISKDWSEDQTRSTERLDRPQARPQPNPDISNMIIRVSPDQGTKFRTKFKPRSIYPQDLKEIHWSWEHVDWRISVAARFATQVPQ